MFLSVFDLFKVGIGPSSSHTVGPMVAARRFLLSLDDLGQLENTEKIMVDLYGSLALTGVGHSTDRAIMLGLSGHQPDQIDPNLIEDFMADMIRQKSIRLLMKKRIAFDPVRQVIFQLEKRLVHHTNGLTFKAFDGRGDLISRENFYSVGGGFVLSEAQMGQNITSPEPEEVPYAFSSGADLLAICQRNNFSIADLMRANEKAFAPENDLNAGLDKLWQVMQACMDRGCNEHGVLPGGLGVERRAARHYQDLKDSQERQLSDPSAILDWINLWALAVNEENAAGGQVVTAPTNGAAGIIPAVLRYYDRFYNRRGAEAIRDFLLTAAAIGSLYKKNASISGAEVGCQGEVGVACSMAAAGLAAVMGGSVAQVENAAEIGMEHNLGLTCDPVGGLVQVPCIERNAMGAVKAVDAARLALRGDGTHMVSLDKVIETMRQTGEDMKSKYKETSQGGLAVNMVEC